MPDHRPRARPLRRRAALRLVTSATALVALGGLVVGGGCSSTGRELPAPTTTRPPTPQVVTTATVR